MVRVAENLVQELIEAGCHYGHRASRWNPKMAPYIYARKNQIHIIDIRETVRGLLRAKKYLSQVASGGSLILFVGTKRQATEAVTREAERARMPFVAERWSAGKLSIVEISHDRVRESREVSARGGKVSKQFGESDFTLLNNSVDDQPQIANEK